MSKSINDMPFEIISMIIKHSNMASRMQLKLCNRQLSAIDDTVPYDLKDVVLIVRNARNQTHPEFRVVDPKTELKVDNVCWKVIGPTTIELKIDDETKVITLDDPRAVILSIFEKIVFNRGTRIEGIYIDAPFKPEYMRYSNMVKASGIDVLGVDWLQVFVPNCLCLRIFGYPAPTPLAIPWTPLVSNARSIIVDNTGCNINDEQLLSSRWEWAAFGKTSITEVGLNSLIKKWIDEGYDRGSYIMLSGNYQWRRIVEGLRYKRRLLLQNGVPLEDQDELVHLEIEIKNEPYIVECDDMYGWQISIKDKPSDEDGILYMDE